MRVLIALPYTDGRLFDQTLTCALSLDVAEGARYDYLLQRGDGHDLDLPDRRDRIVRKREQAREHALAHGYDYLCFVDSDMVFHPDSLSRLISTMTTHHPAVVYGLYCVRKEPYWWCVSLGMDAEHSTHFPLSGDPDAARTMWNEPALHVVGIGFGMTLIDVSALSDVHFRYDAASYQYEDYWFGLDMWRAGRLQMANLTCRLGHILTDCKHVVWPSDNDRLHHIGTLK